MVLEIEKPILERREVKEKIEGINQEMVLGWVNKTIDDLNFCITLANHHKNNPIEYYYSWVKQLNTWRSLDTLLENYLNNDRIDESVKVLMADIRERLRPTLDQINHLHLPELSTWEQKPEVETAIRQIQELDLANRLKEIFEEI